MARLLNVENLVTEFKTERGIVRAVDGISYGVEEGEILGLVGESGCGKSVSQLSILQLIATPPGRIVSGSVEFEGEDLLRYKRNSKELCSIRGRKISMIFQEPMTSLNPAMTVGKQMGEVLITHLGTNKNDARTQCIDMLTQVGVPDPDKRFDDYPHHLSGGLRQRIMIAMAMLCNPRMIIADEATTALDATIQAQLLELLYNIVDKYNASLVMVTHNLGIVARYANRICVMYAGRIVETGDVKSIWANPMHPYTEGLINCVPKLDRKLEPIRGMPPSMINRPPTCAFLARCKYRQQSCFTNPASNLTYFDGQHATSCSVRLRGFE